MEWLRINLKTLKPWFFLLIFTNLFFIFLLWVISPKNFSSIVVISLIFTLFIIVLGCYLERKQQQKKITLVQSFLDNPNDITTQELIDALDKSWQQIVCDTSVDLREQIGSLKEKTLELQKYQEFIEAWTHEIKTPLALAVLLLDNRKDEMSPYVYKRMNYVRHTISTDVERILYYARLHVAHVDYQFEKINLQDCVKENLEEFKILYDESNIELKLNLLPIEVVSDKKVLNFIFSQLFTNAFKYSDQSNGIIWVDTWVQEETGDICLTISDNGTGVSPENLPFIFDKGFTGNHHNRQNATGMGLYFAKRYAKELSITIDVENQLKGGQGFGISVKFPEVG